MGGAAAFRLWVSVFLELVIFALDEDQNATGV